MFAIAGFQYPGADLAEVVENHRDGLAYMVHPLARSLGFAAVLVSMALLVRGASRALSVPRPARERRPECRFRARLWGSGGTRMVACRAAGA